MTSSERTYEEGRRDGQIEALEKTAANHAARLDSHSERLRQMERMIWLILGGIAMLQAFPILSAILTLIVD